MKEYLSKEKKQEVRSVRVSPSTTLLLAVQDKAGARLLVKSPALSEVDSEWAAMEEELAGAGAM